MPVLPESTKADFLIYTRVVYRSNNNANAFGGVAFLNANNDSSYAGSVAGSRLAFRGAIVWAQSVSAYKALTAIA